MAPFLNEFVAHFLIVVAASVVVLLASHVVRLPPVIGFLLTGMLIGPSGFGLVPRHEVELFAEIGVVVLLFTVGLEFSVAHLRPMWRPFLVGGSLQVAATIAATTALAAAFGQPLRNAVFLGLLAALSSTALVLKALADRRELQAPQGVLATGIALFQDLCLAPMIVLTPLLAGTATASAPAVLGRLGVAVLLVGASFAAARGLVPRLLHWIVRTRVREVFLLGALGACLGMALLTARLGFSMALGAFLAGLVLSETEYRHQVSAEVLPFRDLFNSLFFVSLGMLLDLDQVAGRLPAVLAVGGGIVVLKAALTAAVVSWMMYPPRVALLTGLALSQVGEFSFVLAGVGQRLGLLDGALYQTFLGASMFTMFLTPLWFAVVPRLAPRAAEWFRLPPALARLRRDLRAPERSDGTPPRAGHVILVGYGLNGRNVSRVLHETAVPFVVLELNGDLVRQARADGMPVVYGDAASPEILEVCGIRAANVLVLAISDLPATRQAVRLARRANPDVYILVRTRNVSEIDELRRLGADEVIPEEFETSIEIFCRVLHRYHVPRNVVDAQVRIVRDAGYGFLRGQPLGTPEAMERIAEILEGTLTETFLVSVGSAADGRTLRDLDLRRRTGATVIAIVRGGEPRTNPAADAPIRPHDTLVLVGNHAALERAFHLLGERVL